MILVTFITPHLVDDRDPPVANGSAPRGHGETNFDTNMAIILSALLCGLLFALGLKTLFRCALRCGRRFAFDSPPDERTGGQTTSTGLKKRALRQIPVTIYGPESDIRSTAMDCAICLGEFMDGEKVRVLPTCNHGFHVRCVDTWLMAHSSCPTCRHSLLDHRAVEGNGSIARGGPVVVVNVGS